MLKGRLKLAYGSPRDSRNYYDEEPGEIDKRSAANALGEIGDSRAVDPLIDMLKSQNWEVRKDAARALGEIGDSRAVDPLIAALKDYNESVRYATADSLDTMYRSGLLDRKNKRKIIETGQIKSKKHAD